MGFGVLGLRFGVWGFRAKGVLAFRVSRLQRAYKADRACRANRAVRYTGYIGFRAYDGCVSGIRAMQSA